jgi:DNA-binding transcriptional ArsR family regulator
MADVGELLRSPLLEELLRVILLDGGEWTADDLSAETAAAYATITKELRRLERAGVVSVRVEGRTKFFSAASRDPATRALARALAASTTEGGADMSKKKKGKKKDGKKKKK